MVEEYYCPIDGEKLIYERDLRDPHDHYNWVGNELTCRNCGAYYSTNPKEHPKQALKHLHEIKRRIKVKKEEIQPLEKIIETAAEHGLLK